MVSRLIRRIRRLCLGSTLCLILLLLVEHDGVFQWNHSGDAGRRVDFFASALTLPQRLAGSTQMRRQNHNRQQHLKQADQHSVRKEDTTQLFAAVSFFASDAGKDRKEAKGNDAPAYIIEPISRTPVVGEKIYKTISNLCIDVFFKELLDPSGKGRVNLLKETQIRYLKNLQSADLERRRTRQPDTNEMFLAYELRKTEGIVDALKQPLLMDEELEGAYNKGPKNEKNSKNDETTYSDEGSCYVRGKLLGFVEITQRPYGLGTAVKPSTSLMEGLTSNEPSMRPVLTNLAVLKDCRMYGIGSKLLDACEEHVVNNWNMNEIILEVEDYNDQGLAFYERRGYEVLFSDPASRRFDIQGFWLNKVRCRREIMRKALEKKPNRIMKSADNFMRRIRDTVSNL